MKRRNKKQITLSILAITLLLLSVIGVSYAVFTFVGIGQKENTITSGSVTIVYTEGNELYIENAMPLSDEVGKALTGDNNLFTFTVQANITGSNVISYEIAAVKKETSTLQDDEIKIYLEKNDSEVLSPTHFIPIDEKTEIGSPIGSMVIDRGTFTKSTTNEYTMKMWVDENTEITDVVKTYTITVDVYAKDILVGSGPAPEECFVFDSGTGTITGYKCGYNNTNNMKYFAIVDIPSLINGVKVTAIGDNAFYNKQLMSVKIPEGVTTIGARAFYINQLTELILPESVDYIKEWAFFSNHLSSLIIPDGVVDIKFGAFNNNQLPDDQAFIYLRNGDGTEDKTHVISYGGAKRDHVIIPNSVTIIGSSSFRNNNLTSVVIPESVTKIGSSAFQSNYFTSLTIPNTVVSMGTAAFVDNRLPDENAFIYNRKSDGSIDYTSLNSYGGAKRDEVIIPDNVVRIEPYALHASKLANVIIPNSVTVIGSYSFYGNELSKVVIPTGVVSIGAHAFNKNNQLAKLVNLTGKAFDWNNIISGNSGTSFVTGSVGSVIISGS